MWSQPPGCRSVCPVAYLNFLSKIQGSCWSNPKLRWHNARSGCLGHYFLPSTPSQRVPSASRPSLQRSSGASWATGGICVGGTIDGQHVSQWMGLKTPDRSGRLLQESSKTLQFWEVWSRCCHHRKICCAQHACRILQQFLLEIVVQSAWLLQGSSEVALSRLDTGSSA